MKTELLAPAKNIEIAKIAIDSGADAVYIGASDFGARCKAGNSIEDIEKLVKYAHKFYVKVYVTVNTIIKDSEKKDVISLIRKLYEIGVDALIIQDPAIILWSKEGVIPPIQLHISTQCDNRTVEKASFFHKLGLSRVVLARELSLKKIEEIKQENPDLELECFCHGALCVSYSGQCYMSQYIGGRSANRGECAQPCRKKYSLVDSGGNIILKDKHLLSLKDFNASEHIEKMVKIGVDSFKIEGRLKDGNYVKNVVGFYRKLLDKYSDKVSSGSIELGFSPDVNKTFNRGYTDYFLVNRGECFNFDSPKFVGEYIGKISKINDRLMELKLNEGIKLSNQDGLCFDRFGEKGAFINKVDRNRVYLSSRNIQLKVGMPVYRNVDVEFIKTLENSCPQRLVSVKILYSNNWLTAVDEDNNKASCFVEEIESAKNVEKNIDNFKKSMNKVGAEGNIFKALSVVINSELPFMPISKMNEYRRILFENLLTERLKNYKIPVQKNLSFSKYFCNEIDYRGNVYNSDAEQFYKNCSASVSAYAFECSAPNKNVELMRTKHCIKYAIGKCKSSDKLFLVDDKGTHYPLVFDCKNCEMAILKP